MTKPYSHAGERGLVFTNYRLAAAGAANADRNLLAVDATDTTCDRVRNFPWDTLVDLNRLLLADRLAYGVAHSLGALLGHHAAHLVAAGLGFGNHLAHFVAASFGALLGYHTAHLVAASFGFGNHLADFVAHGLGALLRHHFADLVAASLGFGNHLAHLVAASAGALLGNHLANFVAASFGFRNHFAHLVADRAGARLAYILGAADFLVLAGGHPNPLAASAIGGFAGERYAGTGAVHATATIFVVAEGAGLADGLGERLARDGVGFGGPVAASNLDRLGVGDLDAYVIGFFTLASFPNGLADGVGASLGFPDWLANGVGNFLLASFPNRLANGVRPLFGFPNGLADGVANFALAGFPNGLADGVGALFGFPKLACKLCSKLHASGGFPKQVCRPCKSSAWFPRRACRRYSRPLFVVAHEHIVCNSQLCLHKLGRIPYDNESHLLTFPLYAADRLHYGVALSLMATGRTSVVPCNSAIPRPCCCWQHNNGEGRKSLH